jgi:DNA-binding transcriptional regulator/RsmH inhibitor MraZ
LLDHAGIGDDVVLAGQAGRIELWPSDTYPGVSTADDDFAVMAEKILGGSSSEL